MLCPPTASLPTPRDPAEMSPDERLAEVAAILALGLHGPVESPVTGITKMRPFSLLPAA